MITNSQNPSKMTGRERIKEVAEVITKNIIQTMSQPLSEVKNTALNIKKLKPVKK